MRQGSKQQRGQGFVELLILTSLLGLTLTYSVTQLNQALTEQHEQLDTLKASILQPVPQPTWQRHANDPFSRQVAPIIQPLQRYTQLNVALDNLYSVAGDHPHYQLARLVDGWQAQRANDLISMPQSLTLSHYLEQLGIGPLLNFIGHLPMAKELAAGQLQFGKIAPDVTPFELRCWNDLCRQ